MIILSLDFETTGLDFEKDRVIEVGAVLFSTGQNRILESFGRLVKSDVPITAEITEITGIHQAVSDRFGYEQEDSFSILNEMIESCDAVVAHNGNRFDKNMLQSWGNRLRHSIPEKLWIDTMIDIKGHEGKKLSYLAADHGIINHFPHSALADCETVLTIVSKYEISTLVDRANTPAVYVQSHANRNENDKVKKQKFRWNPQHKTWWKAVKETDVDELTEKCPFRISFVPKEIILDLLSS